MYQYSFKYNIRVTNGFYVTLIFMDLNYKKYNPEGRYKKKNAKDDEFINSSKKKTTQGDKEAAPRLYRNRVNQLHAADIAKLGIGVIIVFVLAVFAFRATDGIKISPSMTGSYQAPEPEYVVRDYVRKKKKIERSFGELMAEGEAHANAGDHRAAMKAFYYAKTVYPYDFQARYALSKTFYTLSSENVFFAKKALKEIDNALKYAYNTEDVSSQIEELKEFRLDLIQKKEARLKEKMNRAHDEQL